MRAYYERASYVPPCPVCHGRHYPATNGAGWRVWCDGSHAESESERAERERRDAEAFRERDRLAREHAAERRRESARKGAETRRRNAERERLRAETRRKDAPPLDPAIDRVPESLPENL